MSITPKYYIVDAKALPDVFLKVAEAKRMLETGEASTVGEATRRADVSRSAFYKYKDMVMPFNNMRSGRILKFYTLLKDKPGVMSSVLAMVRQLENPTEEEIQQYLAGNLCRCSGYQGQLRAIKKYLAAKAAQKKEEARP